MPTPPPASSAPIAEAPKTIASLSDIRQEFTFVIDWFSQHSIAILVAMVAGILFYTALRFVRRLVRRHAEKQRDVHGVFATALRVLARTGHKFMIIAATRLVAGLAVPPAAIMAIVQIAFIIALTIQAAVWARALIMDVVRERASNGAHETLGNAMTLINILISTALFAIATIVILDNLGVNVTGLIAGLGIGGIAIGLAAQGIFADLFASLSIIFDRPFRIGDSITYDQTTATVERIGLKSTRLRSVNGQQIVISNTNLLGKEINNFTRLHKRRISFAIGLIYQTSPADLRAVPVMLEQIAVDAGHRFVRAGFIAFGNSSLDFEFIVDVETDDFAILQRVRHDIGLRLFELFGERGLEFAYPTQTSFSAAPDGTLVLPYLTPERTTELLPGRAAGSDDAK